MAHTLHTISVMKRALTNLIMMLAATVTMNVAGYREIKTERPVIRVEVTA